MDDIRLAVLAIEESKSTLLSISTGVAAQKRLNDLNMTTTHLQVQIGHRFQPIDFKSCPQETNHLLSDALIFFPPCYTGRNVPKKEPFWVLDHPGWWCCRWNEWSPERGSNTWWTGLFTAFCQSFQSLLLQLSESYNLSPSKTAWPL